MLLGQNATLLWQNNVLLARLQPCPTHLQNRKKAVEKMNPILHPFLVNSQ